MSTVALPPKVTGLLDEVTRIENKLAEAAKLGGDQDLLQEVEDGLKEFRGIVADAVLKEAGQELAAGMAQAGKILEPVVEAPKPVEPGEDQKRLAGVDDEIKRIQAKIKAAEDHGADFSDVNQLNKDIAALDEPIKEAALAAARRELAEVEAELERIKEGRPDPEQDRGADGGPGSDGKDGKDGKDGEDGQDGGGGGGAAGDGDDADAKKNVKGKYSETAKKKEPLTIFVRSKRTVWAWSRANGRWLEQSFDSDLKEVKIITGGILAVAENGAALWDTFLGRWLGQLSVAPDSLEQGEAS